MNEERDLAVRVQWLEQTVQHILQILPSGTPQPSDPLLAQRSEGGEERETWKTFSLEEQAGSVLHAPLALEGREAGGEGEPDGGKVVFVRDNSPQYEDNSASDIGNITSDANNEAWDSHNKPSENDHGVQETAHSLSDSDHSVQEPPDTLSETSTTVSDVPLHPTPYTLHPAQSALLLTWQATPLLRRLKFAREALPEEAPDSIALKEAMALEELRQKGQDLQSWLTGYPSLFADSADRLDAELPRSDDPAHALAAECLHEAREALRVTLDTGPLVWIVPKPGQRLDAEMEIVGEEAAEVPVGSVARTVRRGFRWQGRLLLAAQVTKAKAAGRRPEAEGENLSGEERRPQEPVSRKGAEAQKEPTNAGRPQAGGANPSLQETRHTHAVGAPIAPALWPEWLKTFQRHTTGCTLPVIRQVSGAFLALTSVVTQFSDGTVDEQTLLEPLSALLPLLGAPHLESLLQVSPEWSAVVQEARTGLLAWLRSRTGFELIVPVPRAPFDANTMQETGTRRTAHAQEDHTVARVEQVGLQRQGRTLLRAQVVRYTTGGA